MTIPGIWTSGDKGWELTRPEGFPDEATLHDLIQEAPEMLPLAGAPSITILGREVGLGSGSADLLGVEASGRPVLIEVKLKKNNEARRAVVAQILAYAAYLDGTTTELLEERLRDQLQEAEHATILDAVTASDQEGVFDRDGFTNALGDHLEEGRFRLVIVLDDAPPELSTLVAYLEHVTDDKLVIDLVVVSNFDVNGAPVMIPQRVTPERHEAVVEQTRSTGRRADTATRYPGIEEFEALFDDRSNVEHVLEWARDIEQSGFASLTTTIGRRNQTLHLRPRGARGGLTIWRSGESDVALTWAKSVFQRRAPDFFEQMEERSFDEQDDALPPNAETLKLLTRALEQASK